MYVMRYEKTPIDTKLQVEKLKNRGLIVKDELLAEQYLRNISYYRLRAYTYPFQMNEEDKEHVFLQTDISFEDVIELYHFDRRLSSLLFNVIEKIEVAMRTRIALTYSVDTGDGFWFLNDRMYFLHEKFLALTRNEVIEGRRYIGELMKEIERSNEEFIACYYDKYCAPAFPPSWMTLEVVSMGTLSKLFSALDKNVPSCKSIVKDLGLYKFEILRNWLHALSSLRNICAHHGRLWNRRFTIELEFPNRTEKPFLSREEIAGIRKNKLFGYLSVMLYLLQFISPESSFKANLLELLNSRPKLVKLKEMGFPEQWQNYTLWK